MRKSLRLAVWLVCCMFCIIGKSSDTLYIENFKDARLQLYLDSLKGYEIGFSVAKNVADSVRHKLGNNTLDPYFLSRYISTGESFSYGYFYDFNEDVPVVIGHVNDAFHGIKSDSIIPWQYVEAQYKRLDAIKVKPSGVIQGAELPHVYVYPKPAITVIYRKIKRYTVIDPSIKFLKREDGKTKVAYILKYNYIKEGDNHERIDSMEKLDPIKQEHLFF